MSGVKGKSGRYNEVDEKTKRMVISKSWDRLLLKFIKAENNPKKVTKEDERQLDYISIEMAKKSIPQIIDATVNVNKMNYDNAVEIIREAERSNNSNSE